MADVDKSAPKSEKGQPAFGSAIPGMLPGWTGWVDDREYVAELTWPNSIEVYQHMQSDAQLRGLLMATTLPVRRFLWSIDPNGAKPEVVAHIADSWNLPIKDQEAPTQTRGFNHDRHMAYAFQSFAYGHYYFERTYEYRPKSKGGDDRLHLVRLGTRPPRTISNFIILRDGTLKAIEQMTGLASGGLTGIGTPLERKRLLPYVWDRQDDADWVGRSMLRACYKNWLIKDRLLRVDATKHERNAMGIPWYETAPGATQKQIDDLAIIAEEIRASQRGGGAGPGKLRIAGVEGTLPDTIGSVRYHDEQMAKEFLLLFFNLGGGSETGNRALGESFIEWYTENQGGLADFYVAESQEQINDEVEVNWGPGEQCPVLHWTRIEATELAFSDLVNGVDKGLIAVDPEIESYIRQRWRVPASVPTPATVPPTPPPTPTPPAATDPATRPLSAPKRSALAARIEKVVNENGSPMKWTDAARAVGVDPKGGTGRRARDELVNGGSLAKRHDNSGAVVLAPLASIKLPDRDLKRQPLAFEVAASVDFAAMEQTFLDGRESLVDAVKSMQSAQIDELAAKVEAANGDVAKLTTLTVEPVDADVIAERLVEIAREGVASARSERDAQLGASASQPVSAAEADDAAIEAQMQERADAVSLTLAGGFAAAASKRAAAVATLPPEVAAANVREYLGTLSDAELELQLGGATTQAYNTGRREYMSVNAAKSVYASEILDGNTCAACNGIDGTEWNSVAEAEASYPIGGYVGCEAGLRCRGTLVAVY